MANKKGKTAYKGGKAVPILGAVLAVLAAGMIAALCLPKSSGSEFTPPPFEENAAAGVPEVAEGTKVKLKIMGYEPETYLSAGAVTLNTAIGGKSA